MTDEARETNAQPDGRIWLLEPKQSRIGYWLLQILAALQVFAAAALLAGMASSSEAALAAVLLLAAALFLAVAWTLGAAKGGLALDPGRGRVSLFGRDEHDRVDVPLADLAAIACERRTEYWGRSEEPVFVWTVHLPTRGGTSLYVLELPTGEDAQEAAVTLRQPLKLQIVHESPGPARADNTMPRPAGLLARPSEGAAETFELSGGPLFSLSLPILLLSALALVSGTAVLAAVTTTGVVGFLFGPVLAALGVCLLAFWLVNSFGCERLSFAPGRLEHSFHFARFAWGRKVVTVTAQNPLQARLRTGGAIGFRLELLAGREMIIAGAGATARSRLRPQGLLELGNYVLARTACAAPADGTTIDRAGETPALNTEVTPSCDTR